LKQHVRVVVLDLGFFRVDGSRQKQKAQTGIRDLRILVGRTIFRSRHNIKTLSGERLNMMCPGSARAAEIEMSIRSSDSERTTLSSAKEISRSASSQSSKSKPRHCPRLENNADALMANNPLALLPIPKSDRNSLFQTLSRRRSQIPS
jgi:hypothetical protein